MRAMGQGLERNQKRGKTEASFHEHSIGLTTIVLGVLMVACGLYAHREVL